MLAPKKSWRTRSLKAATKGVVSIVLSASARNKCRKSAGVPKASKPAMTMIYIWAKIRSESQ